MAELDLTGVVVGAMWVAFGLAFAVALLLLGVDLGSRLGVNR